MSLRTKETVAGAVAREIERIAQTGDATGEGTAYKAEFDRRGSNALKHCDDFRRDAERFYVYGLMCNISPHQPQRLLTIVKAVAIEEGESRASRGRH